MTATCCIGRELRGSSELIGMDLTSPCAEPITRQLRVQTWAGVESWYFCATHAQVVHRVAPELSLDLIT